MKTQTSNHIQNIQMFNSDPKMFPIKHLMLEKIIMKMVNANILLLKNNGNVFFPTSAQMKKHGGIAYDMRDSFGTERNFRKAVANLFKIENYDSSIRSHIIDKTDPDIIKLDRRGRVKTNGTVDVKNIIGKKDPLVETVNTKIKKPMGRKRKKIKTNTKLENEVFDPDFRLDDEIFKSLKRIARNGGYDSFTIRDWREFEPEIQEYFDSRGNNFIRENGLCTSLRIDSRYSLLHYIKFRRYLEGHAKLKGRIYIKEEEYKKNSEIIILRLKRDCKTIKPSSIEEINQALYSDGLNGFNKIDKIS